MIQAQEHPESLNYPVYLGSSQKPNVAGLGVTSAFTHVVWENDITSVFSQPLTAIKS